MNTIKATSFALGLSLLTLGRLPQAQADVTIQSPRKDFHIDVKVKSVDGGLDAYQVYIVSNRGAKVRHRLMPQRIDSMTDSYNTGILGDFHISPDEQWIFEEGKYVHGISVASLYKRHGEADYRPAMSLRFDEAAWRYYAATHGWKRSQIPAMDSGPRIIDFVGWQRGSRRLVFHLRPIKGYGEKQDYGWTGFYDTATGRFGSLR